MSTLKDAKIITAMVTPFNEKGQVDFDLTTQLVEHLLGTGSLGLVVGGTTGESPTLSKEEKLALYQHVVAVVAGRVPIIAGTGSNNTAETIAFTNEVGKIQGITAALVVAPYYNKPNQAGLFAHFSTVAEASTLPIIVYNVPSRTGVSISVETTLALAQLPNIIGTKECAGLEAISEIITGTDNDFLVYSGEDATSLPTLAIGGTGVISVASHVLGNQMTAMYQAFEAGNSELAASLHRALIPKMDALFKTPSPAPVKAVLNQQGIEVGSVRLPLVPCTDSEKKEILMRFNLYK